MVQLTVGLTPFIILIAGFLVLLKCDSLILCGMVFRHSADELGLAFHPFHPNGNQE